MGPNALYVSPLDAPPVALDPDTGSVLWTAIDAIGTTTPALAQGRVVTGSGLGDHMYGISAQTGQTIWTVPTGAGAFSSATLYKGTLMFGSTDGRLRSVDVRTGTEVWTTNIGDPITGSPAVRGGRVYVVTSFRRWAASLDADTGEILWKVRMDGDGTFSSPVLDGSSLYFLTYVGSLEGTVYAFDALTGQVLWSAVVGESVTTPIVVDGMLYFSSFDNHVYAYGLP